jgi:hypothetical protein
MFDFCPCTGSAICKVNAVVKLLPTSQVRTESLKIAKKKLKKRNERKETDRKIYVVANTPHGGFA